MDWENHGDGDGDDDDDDDDVGLDATNGMRQTKAGGYLCSEDKPNRIRQKIAPLDDQEEYVLEFYVKLVGHDNFTFKFGGRFFASYINGDLHEIKSDDPKKGRAFHTTLISGFDGGGGFISFDFSDFPLGSEAYIDNVSLVCDVTSSANCQGGSVPEPGSLLLVGAALAGLGLVRRRKSV